jgi:signal transduction histidine kinase
MINSGYHPPEFFKHLWQTISSGKIWKGEIRNRAKDGSLYWVYTTIVPFLDDSGEPYQYVSIRYEITHQKDLEEQERMASIGMLASSLAHEIGTPLGVIRGRGEVIGMTCKDHPSVQKNVEIILSQIDRVSGLIRSLLNLARGDAADEIGPVRLQQSFDSVLALVSHETRKSGIRVVNGLSDLGPLWVRASPEKLQQVILNLTMNAIHAIQGAQQAGPAREPVLHYRVKIRNGFITLQVADSGTGIAPDNLKKLFQPFFTTKEIGVGTGLGLATSLRIVQSWGGSITVESELGKGSVFSINLAKEEPLQ